MIPYAGQNWGPKGTKDGAKWFWWVFAIIFMVMFLIGGAVGDWTWGLFAFAAGAFVLGWLQRFTT
jgi:Flp pilus assembly protein TadB